MKRATSIIFLLIFTASSVGRIVARTQAWAAESVHRAKHLDPHRTGQSTAELQKQNTREKQTKLMEDGSVLHVSFVQSSNIPPATDAFARTLTGFVVDVNNRPLSSRAPPSLLFF